MNNIKLGGLYRATMGQPTLWDVNYLLKGVVSLNSMILVLGIEKDRRIRVLYKDKIYYINNAWLYNCCEQVK